MYICTTKQSLLKTNIMINLTLTQIQLIELADALLRIKSTSKTSEKTLSQLRRKVLAELKKIENSK